MRFELRSPPLEQHRSRSSGALPSARLVELTTTGSQVEEADASSPIEATDLGQGVRSVTN